MTQLSQILEPFDASIDTETGPSEDYTAGFADGLAEAERRFQDSQSALSEELVSVIADWDFGFVEARAHLIAGLRPLFDAISRQLVPQLAKDTLWAHVATALLTEAEQCEGQITLYLNGQIAAQVAPLIADKTNLPLECREDPTLSKMSARWSSTTGEQFFDLTPLCTQVSEALSAILEAGERKMNDGHSC